MLRAVDGHRCRIGAVNCMTAQAIFEAVCFTPDAPVHGLVALVIKQIHVVTPHEVRVFDATVALALGNFRHRDADVPGVFRRCPSHGGHACEHNR